MRVIEAAQGAGAMVHFGASPEVIAARGRGRLGFLASPVSGRVADEADSLWFLLERMIVECGIDLDALAGAGVVAISPVLMALEMIRSRGGGALAAVHGTRGVLAQECWRHWSGVMLARCDFVVVADRPGWQESRGIAREFELALARNRPVFFMGVSG